MAKGVTRTYDEAKKVIELKRNSGLTKEDIHAMQKIFDAKSGERDHWQDEI